MKKTIPVKNQGTENDLSSIRTSMFHLLSEQEKVPGQSEYPGLGVVCSQRLHMCEELQSHYKGLFHDF